MLPRIESPTFTLEVPSTKEKINMRLMKVSDEKILLMAKESKDPGDILAAVKQVVQNCLVPSTGPKKEEVSIDDWAIFDIEYAFLQLRAHSVSDAAEVSYIDNEDVDMAMTEVPVAEREAALVKAQRAATRTFKIDLKNIKVKFPEKTESQIKINNKVGIHILTRILEHVHVPTVVEAESSGDQITLNIISNGSGLLIGKRGKTLQALQYLVSKICQREVGENASVVVDTENYRSKRESGLVELAQQLREKVKKARRPFTTGPLNAHDRRVVHLALKNDQKVRTKSKGEGNVRKVVIYPMKKNKNQTKDPEQSKVEID